ncbi:MAG: isoprenylcysteine carboxylmethyltransferase family protein [Deltaproteobacteria bacterium]|nr:isoprenylcysteine carboxylmethyltransferase family protein [Deltaproteobacteria bacterium]
MALFMKNLLFTLLVPGTVAVLVPLRAFTHSAPTFSLQSVGAGALLLVGGSIYAWCLWDFAVTGRGTPAPIDPPKTLVVRGLYKYTRNPMYVGVLSVIGGWALLFRSFNIFIYGICVAATFNLFVRLYEEPHLKRTFGAAYENYCARVHRWLPFL